MSNSTVLTGPQAFVVIALRRALILYRDHRMMANRSYTPKRMMQKATELTGKTFKARDYQGAIDALYELVDMGA